MRRVLDTNVVSSAMRGDLATLERLEALGKLNALVPQPVWAEIAYGIDRLPASRRRGGLEQRFAMFRSELPTLEWSLEVSLRFGEIKALLERRGAPLEDFDIAIAAHAIASRAIMVTANIRHFRRVQGLEVEDWSLATH